MTGFRKKIVEPPRSLISDAIALLAILAVGTVYLWGSPEIAADLPDDGPSYAIPAVNFLDGKGWGWLAYGQRFGPSHPFGTSLMLLPGYLLAGHFIGNGILSLWFYTMCIAVMVYVVGRIYWGQVAGCLAALFFVGHHGVRLYTQRIMSEVPTLFVYTLVLVLLLYLRKRANARWGYVVLGIVLGLGVVIRVDNWLLVAAAFFLLIRRPLKLFVVHACLVVAGMAPWFIATALYNHHYYGHYHWNGYNYWQLGHEQSEKFPLFSLKYATARGVWTRVGFPPAMADRLDGNFIANIKTLLSESDVSMPFGPTHVSHPRRGYQALILLRTGLGFVGLCVCVCSARKIAEHRFFLMWLASTVVPAFVFFTLWCMTVDRYMLRFAPFFCLLNGIGVQWLYEKAKERARVHSQMAACNTKSGSLADAGTAVLRSQFSEVMSASVPTAALVLVVALMYCGATDVAYHGLPIFPTYVPMQTANRVIETDAVVVTTYDPWRAHFFLARDNDRLIVPMVNHVRINPGPKLPSVSPEPFEAAKEPERLLSLVRSGRPCHLLLDYYYGSHPTTQDIVNLLRYFDAQVLASMRTLDGKATNVFLARLVPKSQPLLSQ